MLVLVGGVGAFTSVGIVLAGLDRLSKAATRPRRQRWSSLGSAQRLQSQGLHDAERSKQDERAHCVSRQQGSGGVKRGAHSRGRRAFALEYATRDLDNHPPDGPESSRQRYAVLCCQLCRLCRHLRPFLHQFHHRSSCWSAQDWQQAARPLWLARRAASGERCLCPCPTSRFNALMIKEVGAAVSGSSVDLCVRRNGGAAGRDDKLTVARSISISSSLQAKERRNTCNSGT